MKNSGKLLEKRRERTYRETLRMIHNELFRVVREQLDSTGQLDHLVEDILDHKQDPYTVMRQIVKNWLSISQK